MSSERKRTARAQPRARTEEPSAPPAGPSGIAAQASGWGRVAAEALERCERGADAEAELRRRRNRSGQ